MSRFISEAGRAIGDLVARTADEGRRSRGRALFRKGAVLDLSIEEGSVIASVRGSEGNVYASTVGTSAAPPGVARQVVQALAAGETVDAVIAEGIDVCPRDIDLGFSCECADWDEPCKHVVALLLALADRVDLDVDELLRWRSIDPQTGADPAEAEAKPAQKPRPEPEPRVTPEPQTPRLAEPESQTQPTADAAETAEAASTDDDAGSESFDEAHERSERLADLKKLLGNTVLRPSRSRSRTDAGEKPKPAITAELSTFLGKDRSIEPPNLSTLETPAPLFAELQLGPLADLGPEFAAALATISELLGPVDRPEGAGPSI